jgi:hypothetical protein
MEPVPGCEEGRHGVEKAPAPECCGLWCCFLSALGTGRFTSWSRWAGMRLKLCEQQAEPLFQQLASRQGMIAVSRNRGSQRSHGPIIVMVGRQGGLRVEMTRLGYRSAAVERPCDQCGTASTVQV